MLNKLVRIFVTKIQKFGFERGPKRSICFKTPNVVDETTNRGRHWRFENAAKKRKALKWRDKSPDQLSAGKSVTTRKRNDFVLFFFFNFLKTKCCT